MQLRLVKRGILIEMIRYRPLKEEECKVFTFPVDSITIKGRPLREFLSDKDADTITFTSVAEMYFDPEPEPIHHIVIVPDSDLPVLGLNG